MVFWRHLWRFEGVVCWEMDSEEEYSTGVWTVALKKEISKILQTNVFERHSEYGGGITGPMMVACQ